MGTDLEPGHVYSDTAPLWTVNAQNLNAHVADATIKATAISSKTAKTALSLTDEFLINDSGVLKKASGLAIQTLAYVPIGTILDYAGSSPPGDWLLCGGQAVSRTTYATLFSVLGSGTVWGAGDGVTTFNLPDLRGRVTAGRDDMAGTAASRLTAAGGIDGLTVGATGGAQTHTLVIAEVPAHTHNVNGGPFVVHAGGVGPGQGTGAALSTQNSTNTSGSGGNGPHHNVQPTIVLNKIIRAI